MKVLKFGGSSLADHEGFNRIKDIVASDPMRTVVVVSAPGKRYSADNKITDLLYICTAHIRYKVSYDDIWNDIKSRYLNIAQGCGLDVDVESILWDVRSNFTPTVSEEYVVSRGEYLSALLMASHLGYAFVDACDVIHFNFDGTVDYDRTYEDIRNAYEKNGPMVVPGFYGSTPDGKLHLFSRGGSDVTGALVAAALDVQCYENWTDVDGILMADPKIVDDPRTIERITFSELRELSYMGAEVLHEETVFPVLKAHVPLYIKNTTNPSLTGTLVMESFDEENEEEKSRFITGITGKRDYSVLTVTKSRMHEDFSFVRRVLEITEKYQLPIEHIQSSVDSFSLVISSSVLSRTGHVLTEEIRKECNTDDIKVDEGVSLIAVVGRRMVATKGVSGKIFAALGEAGINIRIIEQGSDEINIMIGVMDEDFDDAIRTLYHSFT